MLFVASSNQQTFVGVFSETDGIAVSTLNDFEAVYSYARLHLGDSDKVQDFCSLTTFASSLPGKVFAFPQEHQGQPHFLLDLYALDLAGQKSRASNDGIIGAA
jgi:hypothetical protein